MSLYTEMLAAGLVVGNHYSDLYVLDTAEARAIIKKHEWSRCPSFISNTGEGRCLDVPFAFEPYWDKVNGKVAAAAEAK